MSLCEIPDSVIIFYEMMHNNAQKQVNIFLKIDQSNKRLFFAERKKLCNITDICINLRILYPDLIKMYP